ncbi:MAG: trehalose-6-phosphate synthase [Gammaproteobacteria bacterium]|nr:trehalose-6-phosphate synthase [Gammaproteobacteria bacterium]
MRLWRAGAAARGRESLRLLLLRYLVPVAAAVALVAFIGVPYIDRILAGWFRADVQLRAQLLMTSVEEPLEELLQRSDTRRALAYLTRMTSDERLLGAVICTASGRRLLQTALVPDVVDCRSASADPAGSSIVTQTAAGSVEISAFPLKAGSAGPYRLLLVHDLSFINRRQTAARNFVLAVIVVAAAALALLVGLALRLLLNRWIRLLLGDISSRRFLDDARSSRTAMPVLLKVRQALRELETTQRLEIEFHENWTPQALQQVVREQLQGCSMLLVSNREPYIHNADAAGRVVVQVPASGMVTAIEPIMRACSGTWIAHGSGTADRDVVDRHDRVRVPPDDPQYALRRVWLSAEEEEGYYYGFSNEGLWPLCHLAYVRPAFRETDWKQYVAVNGRFADVVVREATVPDPIVLIQDFHFAMLPGLLRRRLPKATIALFWHIPWPNAETFGVCPWKGEILQHMLSADILGFHTRYHCQNFLATVDRFLECQIDHEHMTVTHQGHVCRVAAYPISIEWPPRWLAHVAETAAARDNVRNRFRIGSGVRIGVGVERWDFTKGIIERMQALSAFFERHPEWRGRLTFLQVAAPSRSKLPAYQALQAQTQAEIARVNDRFGLASWQPVVLIPEHQQPEEVYELYRAADFCLVNSLHDGMNLVAKEFVAARDDEDGVLILSSFAGASRELVEALLVNPFDVVETAATIYAALEMPREERRKRMQLMRRTLAVNNVHRWAGRLLMDVARIRQRQSLAHLAGAA